MPKGFAFPRPMKGENVEDIFVNIEANNRHLVTFLNTWVVRKDSIGYTNFGQAMVKEKAQITLGSNQTVPVTTETTLMTAPAATWESPSPRIVFVVAQLSWTGPDLSSPAKFHLKNSGGTYLTETWMSQDAATTGSSFKYAATLTWRGTVTADTETYHVSGFTKTGGTAGTLYGGAPYFSGISVYEYV